MTYIIGARCSDGVVIVGDRLATNADGTSAVIDKIFNPNNGVVAAISGDSSMIFNFSEEIKIFTRDRKQKTLYEWKNALEDIVANLYTRYMPRLGEDPLEVLVSIKNPENNRAELLHIIPTGVAEPVQDYRAIGSGKYFGEAILKPNWDYLVTSRDFWQKQEKMIFLEPTMLNLLPLLAFPIESLQLHQILTNVGKGINMWLIPDIGTEKQITREKTYEEWKKVYDKLFEMLDGTRLYNFLKKK